VKELQELAMSKRKHPYRIVLEGDICQLLQSLSLWGFNLQAMRVYFAFIDLGHFRGSKFQRLSTRLPRSISKRAAIEHARQVNGCLGYNNKDSFAFCKAEYQRERRDKTDGKFLKLPRSLVLFLSKGPLTKGELIVLLVYLIRRVRKKGYGRMSYSLIQKLSNVSAATVDRALRKLKKRGLLEIPPLQKSDHWRTWRYGRAYFDGPLLQKLLNPDTEESQHQKIVSELSVITKSESGATSFESTIPSGEREQVQDMKADTPSNESANNTSKETSKLSTSNYTNKKTSGSIEKGNGIKGSTPQNLPVRLVTIHSFTAENVRDETDLSRLLLHAVKERRISLGSLASIAIAIRARIADLGESELTDHLAKEIFFSALAKPKVRDHPGAAEDPVPISSERSG
jgi:hypothetical protein